MSDVNCPYCGAEIEIDHDDGRGYEEDRLHEQECPKCEKIFVYTTYVMYSYSVKTADCLNGGEHKWKPTMTYPKEFTVMECSECGDRRELTKDEWEEFWKLHGK
jgi:hypothetical protein